MAGFYVLGTHWSTVTDLKYEHMHTNKSSAVAEMGDRGHK